MQKIKYKQHDRFTLTKAIHTATLIIDFNLHSVDVDRRKQLAGI
ncbi:hypothetical protein PSBY109024_03755 [Pseudoalteromonas byunsanensis]